MDRTLNKQSCCVVFPLGQSDMFYMNMRVYRLERADKLGFVPKDDGSEKIIWCAIYRRVEDAG